MSEPGEKGQATRGSGGVSRRRRLSLSHWILIGLVLGIGCGVFLGELSQPLQVIGDVFIRLLQMTILPYIVVSLIANIGGLRASEARTMAGRAVWLQVLFWAIGLAMIVLMAQALPAMETASYYSGRAGQQASADVLSLYVPANPFSSLADGAVPAAVLFSIALGIALLGMPGKEPVIEQLHVIAEALLRVSGFVAKFTPLGVFAIAAAASGRITIEELGRIQAFLIIHTLSVGLLAFLILPWLTAALTPFRMRDVLKHSRDGLVMAFTTGNIFIALPLLFEGGRRLFEQYELDVETTARPFEVVLPIVFSFPNAANLQFLLFVVFAAWFTGAPIEVSGMPQLLGSGFLSLFASDMVAIPFLLDLFRIPADMFQLYVVTSIVAMRTAGLAAIVHLFCVSVLVACALNGVMKLRLHRLAALGIVAVVVVAVAVGGARNYLARATSNTVDGYDVYVSTPMLGKAPSMVTVEEDVSTGAADAPSLLARIKQIKQRGVIRVGYLPDRLPWTFTGPEGELKGFDANMAWMLANDLEVGLEFRPIDPQRVAEQLQSGQIDIVMSGFPLTPVKMYEMQFSEPVLELTAAIAVRDYKRHLFQDIKQIRRIEGLELGVVTGRAGGGAYYASWLRDRLPDATITELTDQSEFFEHRDGTLDGLVTSAEGGSIWAIIHPGFSIVVPSDDLVAVPMAYPVADESLENFVNNWLHLKRANRSIEALRRHWLQGESQVERKPRWSVIRDVLGWVE
jgi:Na+/H+-dicarboxylate symporter/ABC-type amino acid transport substrate-binding protein